jgi:hypothetical protein
VGASVLVDEGWFYSHSSATSNIRIGDCRSCDKGDRG